MRILSFSRAVASSYYLRYSSATASYRYYSAILALERSTFFLSCRFFMALPKNIKGNIASSAPAISTYPVPNSANNDVSIAVPNDSLNPIAFIYQ